MIIFYLCIRNSVWYSDIFFHKKKERLIMHAKEQPGMHITNIMGQYELSTKEILETLDKIATANRRTPIRNLPAYCNSTFRFEHADRARGTP